MIKNALFKNVIDDLDIGYWHLKDNTIYWSTALFEALGFQEEDIQTNLDYFVNNLLHEKCKNIFIDNFYNLTRNDSDFRQIIEIKCKNGQYKEFVCKSNDELPVNVHTDDTQVIFFFERKIKTPSKVKDDYFYYRESAQMTKTGSWYVDFKKQKSYWDLETKRILEYPEDYIPSIKDSAQYYVEEYHQLAADCFFKCAMSGKPFDTEIKMLTANKREFWAKAMGKPVYNDNNEIIGIRGVFQDIDEVKQRENNLIKTSDIISSQNSRLFNFAHIVSHNLRSHSSNLSLITQLIDEVKDVEEKLELVKSIKDISHSLNTTIEHLNDVVTIQTQTNLNKVDICFQTTLNQVMKSIGHIITENNAVIESDFKEVTCLSYIPAYLDSILLNFLTNAIKYKHPDRDPKITIRSYKKGESICLDISDNGIGIDLERFGDKLFGMYKTFHLNKDAVGIGLFITKNQVESLNGKIAVESKVNEGTTFKIEF